MQVYMVNKNKAFNITNKIDNKLERNLQDLHINIVTNDSKMIKSMIK